MRTSTVTPDTLADEEIIVRVLGGEKELYEVIIRRYNQRLFRISRTYVHDADEAEDVVQQAYINAYEHLPDFRGRSKFSTWLTRIVINEAMRKARKSSEGGEFTDDAGEPDDIPSPAHENPARIVMNDELKDILERTIDRLPVKYRSVFVMREIDGMSVAETGASLGISEANVKVRLNRAKEMLREHLGGVYQEAGVYHFDLVRCDRIVANVLGQVKRYGE